MKYPFIRNDSIAQPLSNPAYMEQAVAPKPLYNRVIYFLFYMFALYLVLPLVDVPLLGLSLSAPIFFFIALVCIFKPPEPWSRTYQRWIILAILIFLGIFLSAMANGLLSGGAHIDNQGILSIIQYAYWLLAFVITAYLASQGKVLQTVASLLGWSVMILALLRLGEVAIYGNIGAWTGTHLMTENGYGFLFSIFSPFLLFLMIEQGGWKRLWAIMGNLLLWGAVAINGSRGSWVAIGVGLGLCLLLLVWSRPGKFIGLLVMLLLMGGVLSAAWVALPDVSAKVLHRFNTLQSLNEDKSYMIRQVLIQKALALYEQSPIIGVGVNRFNQSSVIIDAPELLNYKSQASFNRESAHNSYLDFLAENGLLGAVPFALLLLILAIQGLYSAYRGTRRGQYAALAVFLSFVQMSVHMWAIATLSNTANWFIYGLVAAMIILARVESKKAK